MMRSVRAVHHVFTGWTEGGATPELTLTLKGGAVVFGGKPASPAPRTFAFEVSSASSMSLKPQAVSPLHRGASSSGTLTANDAQWVSIMCIRALAGKSPSDGRC